MKNNFLKPIFQPKPPVDNAEAIARAAAFKVERERELNFRKLFETDPATAIPEIVAFREQVENEKKIAEDARIAALLNTDPA